MATNARALLILAQEASRIMTAGGRIIALSSLGSQRVIPGYASIGVSKAALGGTHALSRRRARREGHHREHGVGRGRRDRRVAARCPTARRRSRRSAQRTPGGALVTADEVAGVVLLPREPGGAGDPGTDPRRWTVGTRSLPDAGARRRVVVTGLDLVTPIGADAGRLLEGRARRHVGRQAHLPLRSRRAADADRRLARRPGADRRASRRERRSMRGSPAASWSVCARPAAPSRRPAPARRSRRGAPASSSAPAASARTCARSAPSRTRAATPTAA